MQLERAEDLGLWQQAVLVLCFLVAGAGTIFAALGVVLYGAPLFQADASHLSEYDNFALVFVLAFAVAILCAILGIWNTVIVCKWRSFFTSGWRAYLRNSGLALLSIILLNLMRYV